LSTPALFGYERGSPVKIALIANKGGIGKTTLCLLLDEAFRQAGRSVAVRDLDNPQGTASKALAAFGATREQPGQSYEHLLMDAPPALASPASAAAATTAEVILIPATPSPADIWEARKAVEFAQRKNPWAALRVIVNRLRAGALLTGALEESLQGVGAPLLPARIAERQCYQHLLLKGWPALDPRAAQEALQFSEAVLQLGGQPGPESKAR
jgi:cellulose biosynthesis protein BcsQ